MPSVDRTDRLIAILIMINVVALVLLAFVLPERRAGLLQIGRGRRSERGLEKAPTAGNDPGSGARALVQPD